MVFLLLGQIADDLLDLFDASIPVARHKHLPLGMRTTSSIAIALAELQHRHLNQGGRVASVPDLQKDSAAFIVHRLGSQFQPSICSL